MDLSRFLSCSSAGTPYSGYMSIIVFCDSLPQLFFSHVTAVWQSERTTLSEAWDHLKALALVLTDACGSQV